MLEMTRTDPEWKDKKITGDETWVYGYDTDTKRQSAEWRGQGTCAHWTLVGPGGCCWVLRCLEYRRSIYDSVLPVVNLGMGEKLKGTSTRHTLPETNKEWRDRLSNERILQDRGYFIGKKIGSGTFATVRLAELMDGDHREHLAVKIINRAKASSQFLEKDSWGHLRLFIGHDNNNNKNIDMDPEQKPSTPKIENIANAVIELHGDI
ncbi:TSSK2 [Cordylochernes scorpioides]|uniref:TSSK2 n=1 Tax=Cordylochernes scorpioides TaxID=51811 RepID=A0ABY6LQV4_9ARAC|nr:TSSK2 [Cordylochernes scorpioides]